EGGLPPEDAVELDGVADRLVDLERHLVAGEDEVGRGRRTDGRGEQGAGLVRQPGGVARQVEGIDELPRGRAEVTHDTGIGAPLRLAVADNGRVHEGAALHDV